ncbi:MAG: hypothetical protein JWN22_2188 [Nocardioides sp.]|jgi:hypothetical protein|nr:hypothetical protein [Nocardioides sp.]
MPDGPDDGSLAPRRTLGGPILPPPPPELAEEEKAANRRAEAAKQAAWEKEQADKAQEQRAQARARDKAQEKARAKAEKAQVKAERPARSAAPAKAPKPVKATRPAQGSARRTRRASLRLVQVDAWSVMKTSFLLSIALGIVLVVAVAIIWSVLGAAGVWDSINSIVQQAVGGDDSKNFDIQEYAGTSRVLGFTMIVAVLDVILITAIATLGAFLYNLSAALLGGIEVTLAEDN